MKGKDCIHRFNNVNESLKDRDFRHIKHQMLFVSRQAKVFEESAQKVNKDAQNLMIHMNECCNANPASIKQHKKGNSYSL